MFQRYQTARVASYSLQHFKNGKISKAALLRLLIDPVTSPKIDFAFPEGRPVFSFEDLAKNGGHELHVRHNADRDVAVIPVADTWKKLQAAREASRQNLEPTLGSRDERAPDLAPVLGSRPAA